MAVHACNEIRNIYYSIQKGHKSFGLIVTFLLLVVSIFLVYHDVGETLKANGLVAI